MDTAPVKENADEGKEHVEGVAGSGFEHVPYVVLGKETVEGVDAVRREEVDVKAGGRTLMLNGKENGAGVLDEGGADKSKNTLGLGGAGTCEKNSDLRRSMAASLMSLKKPGCIVWRD